MAGGAAGHSETGARWFASLGRWIVRHPWYPVVFWVVLLVVTIPFLPLLGSVTTNSTQSTSPNSPSAAANAELARLFPNETGGSSSILLFYGANLTDAPAQAAILAVTTALGSDASIVNVASIDSVYSQYSGYLAGQIELTGRLLAEFLNGTPSPLAQFNATAGLLWGPPATFLTTWSALVANGSGEPASHWNYPAYVATQSTFPNSTPEDEVLAAFYDGYGTSDAGFNGTAQCADAADPVACADAVARANLAPLLPGLFPPPSEGATLGAAALANLGTGNCTNWASIRFAVASVAGPALGISPTWVAEVWGAFPDGPTPAAARAWANATVATATLWSEPLPVPPAIWSQYVNGAGTAQVVSVDFSVADSSTNGGSPTVFADLPRIDATVTAALASSDPSRSIAYVQTGPAPLDLLTQDAVNSSLALVLPLTVGLLLTIAMVYFRSPLTPLCTFAALGIALVLGLGGTVLIGTLVQHVDSTSLTLEEVFVLGVGTDYSIFLVARYREELVHGATPDEAIVASVSWAGQSVATSGSTAIIATAALAFSGVALLSEWGSVLSLAVFVTLVLSLTLVPALLKLVGPRIFWPMSGARFRAAAQRTLARTSDRSTYFYRAGRATARRPGTFAGSLLLVSIPLVLVALTVPISYDFYAQLPNGHPATDGLAELGTQFGPGYATPSFALVTFSSPLYANATTNATEFTDLAALTAIANETGGIAAVTSPIGPTGAPLGQWLDLPLLPPAERENLLAVLATYLGTDGRTVLLDLQTSATGLSGGAVTAVGAVEGGFGGYAASHPEIAAISYGGGAPTIHDLAQETAQATTVMIVAVSVGLVVVLLAVLRSWIIALMAVGTIGLSISWAWAVTDLVFQQLLGYPLFFYVRTILIILVLGLGVDYNIFLLTRVREERVRGRPAPEAAVEAVGKTGGIITAAAVILASAFAALLVGEFTLIRAIGFSVAVAVVLDAMVIRTYLVPATLQLLGERVWSWTGRVPARAAPPTSETR